MIQHPYLMLALTNAVTFVWWRAYHEYVMNRQADRELQSNQRARRDGYCAGVAAKAEQQAKRKETLAKY